MKRILFWLLILSFVGTNVFAAVIVVDGKKIEVGDGKDYGVSHGYNPKDHTNNISRENKKKEIELMKVAHKLQERFRKEKNPKERDRLADMLDKVSKEMEKLRAEWKFEDYLETHPDSPKKNPHRGRWRREMRKKRMKELEKKQRELEEKRRKEKEKAKKLKQLKGIGSVDMRDVTDVATNVSDAIKDQSDAKDDFAQAGCDEIDDHNYELCNELRVVVSETTATLEEEEARLKKLLGKLPAILTTGGSVYNLYEGISKIHQKYKDYLDGKRKLKVCEINCELLEQEVHELENSLIREEMIQGRQLEKLEDDNQASELDEEVKAELVIPDYLSAKQGVPFGNEEFLPLAFGVSTPNSAEAFKSVRVLVNGEVLNADFYPEAGVIRTNYVGFDKKQGFEGKVVLESVDGRVFEQQFFGRINTLKPTVKITKKGGGLFSRPKFKVLVEGEFDQIKVSGTNIKEQVFKFETAQTKKEFTIKTLRRGEASLKVEASLRTKLARVPNTFEGRKLSTDSTGRILNDETRLLPSLLEGPEDRGQVELGFCCEEVGELSCVGCIAGKRSRKSCKALNKLPGYNFKAFLRASDLECTAL